MSEQSQSPTDIFRPTSLELEMAIVESRNQGREKESAAAEKLLDAYAVMALGIQTDVKSGQKIGIHEIVTDYDTARNELARKGTLTWGLRVEDADRKLCEPDYVTAYKQTRKMVFQELLRPSVRENDFRLLMTTIATVKDPVMAQWLIDKIFAEKISPPHWYAGGRDFEKLKDGVRSHNQGLSAFRSAAKRHAKQQKNIELSEQFDEGNINTARFVLTSIGLKLGIQSRRITDEMLIGPVIHFSRFPIVESQLLAMVKNGDATTTREGHLPKLSKEQIRLLKIVTKSQLANHRGTAGLAHFLANH